MLANADAKADADAGHGDTYDACSHGMVRTMMTGMNDGDYCTSPGMRHSARALQRDNSLDSLNKPFAPLCPVDKLPICMCTIWPARTDHTPHWDYHSPPRHALFTGSWGILCILCTTVLLHLLVSGKDTKKAMHSVVCSGAFVADVALAWIWVRSGGVWTAFQCNGPYGWWGARGG